MHFSFDFVGSLAVFEEELGGGAILFMAETLRSDLRRSDRRMFGVFEYVGRFCVASSMAVSDRQNSPAIAASDVDSKAPPFLAET